MKEIQDSTILYIDNDAITKKQLVEFLVPLCKTLHTAVDGQVGFELFKKIEPDIVITEIEIPKLNGLEMTRRIRELSLSVQIIIITAHKKPDYLLEAINLQLTQYILKPLSFEKVSQALKLASVSLDSQKLETRKYFGERQYYDIYTKELTIDNKIISLSKHERLLLELMIKKHPAPISYESINTNIYDSMSSKNAIKLLIRSLRSKVGKGAISNISGFGYKLNLVDRME